MKNVVLDGWVHTDNVRNVFTEAFRDVTEKMCVGDRLVTRRELESFLEDLRLRLFEKASRERKREVLDQPYKETPDSREQHLAFKTGRLGRGI